MSQSLFKQVLNYDRKKQHIIAAQLLELFQICKDYCHNTT